MPIDFQEVKNKIQQISLSAVQEQILAAQKYTLVGNLLAQNSQDYNFLQNRVKLASQLDSFLRCATPTNEKLDIGFPCPSNNNNVTVIAADGSQIYPDRHAPVLFYLINVGTLVMRQSQAPIPQYQTKLFFGDDIYIFGNILNENVVNLQRDQWEREILLEKATLEQNPVVTLTDGPIELWGQSSDNNTTFTETLESYLEALRGLCKISAITGGYVDRPRADLVVQMLEIANVDEKELKNVRQNRPFRGITDAGLYKNILNPGERTAIFKIQSKSATFYKDELALHFFYLNVGRAGKPWLARIEIPQWVAGDLEKVNILHATILEQCKILGTRRYPYILHRAHETAIVRFDEKEQLINMLTQQIIMNGGEFPEETQKQAIKNLEGRRRFTL